jgi:hypothetical protein
MKNNIENQGKEGYLLTRFDGIKKPHLKGIAPQTPTKGKPVAAGYCVGLNIYLLLINP